MSIQIRRVRHPIKNSVTLRSASVVCRAKVLDLNETGIRVQLDTPIAPGTRLTVTINDSRIAGRLRWSQRGEGGIAFTPHISSSLLARLRREDSSTQPGRYDSTALKELR